MAREDNSFTDNMSAVSRQYATAAGLETDKKGQVKHIDKVKVEAEKGETTPETEAAVANPNVDEPAVVVEGSEDGGGEKA